MQTIKANADPTQTVAKQIRRMRIGTQPQRTISERGNHTTEYSFANGKTVRVMTVAGGAILFGYWDNKVLCADILIDTLHAIAMS